MADPSPEPVDLPLEADQAARELAAVVRTAAASLPFGPDPAEFVAALERLVGEDEEAILPVTAG